MSGREDTGRAPTPAATAMGIAVVALVVAVGGWTRGSDALLTWGLLASAAVSLVALAGVVVARRDAPRVDEPFAAVRAVVDQSPDAALLVDEDGRVLHANPGAGTLLGWRPDDLVGRDVEVLVPPAARQRHVGLRRGFVAAPHVGPMGGRDPVQLRRADGVELPVEIALAPVPVGGRTVVSVALRDASTHQQRIDALLRLEGMQALFLQSISHELRTPLAIVVGMADLAATGWRDMPPERLQAVLDGAVRGARRLDRLIGDLLDLQRVAEGREREAQRVPARRIEELVRTAAREERLEDVVVDVDAAADARVDPVLLERGLHNLLSNARKYAPGRVEVAVRDADGGVEVIVEDHGAGIPPHLRERIFEPFARGETVDPATPGVGIGLSLVSGLVAASGGRADVAGRRDGTAGASFRLWFPSADAAAGATPELAGSSGSTRRRTRES